jgi:hypothetical protein
MEKARQYPAIGLVVIWRMSLMLLALSQPLGAETVLTLPSGAEVRFLDQIWEEDSATLRQRYLVPQLAEPASVYLEDGARVFGDMQHLCDLAIATAFDGADPQDAGWERAVITLMSAPLEFGQRDPDVVQVFEGFVFTSDGCDWDDGDFHD